MIHERRVERYVGECRTGVDALERASVVPGHPLLGMGSDLTRVTFKFGEVIEWIGPVELARVDERCGAPHLSSYGELFVMLRVFLSSGRLQPGRSSSFT